jgi:hypothetical protein
MKLPVGAPLLLGLLATCAPGRGSVTAATSPLVPDGYAGRYQVDAFVLEDASHGPQMCGSIMLSHPPQCSGPDLVGWSWADLKHESVDQSRWGSYLITGRFDGTKLTVAEVAEPGPRKAKPAPAERGDRTPCPEPPGGWRPIDLAKTTDAAMQAANALAQRSPDYAGLWIDQGHHVTEATANDPRQFILNVSFTGDIAGHTTELREVWGGALCVSQARYSEARLSQIQNEVMRSLRGSSSDIDVYTNRVTVQTWLAFEQQQKEMDARYGAGAVVLTSLLRPID